MPDFQSQNNKQEPILSQVDKESASLKRSNSERMSEKSSESSDDPSDIAVDKERTRRMSKIPVIGMAEQRLQQQAMIQKAIKASSNEAKNDTSGSREIMEEIPEDSDGESDIDSSEAYEYSDADEMKIEENLTDAKPSKPSSARVKKAGTVIKTKKRASIESEQIGKSRFKKN